MNSNSNKNKETGETKNQLRSIGLSYCRVV